MRSTALGLAVAVVVVSGAFGFAKGEPSKGPLVPGYEAARDLPGARELPDPKTDYKVVFADGQDAKNPGDINPMLPSIATYLNTLGKYGVPAEHRHIVIMFHQRTPDIDIVMTNEAYRERYNRDNPNIDHPRAQAGRCRHPRVRPGPDRAEDRREAGEPRRADRSVGDDDAGEPAVEGLRQSRIDLNGIRRRPAASLPRPSSPGWLVRPWTTCLTAGSRRAQCGRYQR